MTEAFERRPRLSQLLTVRFRATPLESRRFGRVLRALVYVDHEMSGGMKRGIAVVETLGAPVTIWVIGTAPTV